MRNFLKIDFLWKNVTSDVWFSIWRSRLFDWLFYRETLQLSVAICWNKLWRCSRGSYPPFPFKVLGRNATSRTWTCFRYRRRWQMLPWWGTLHPDGPTRSRTWKDYRIGLSGRTWRPTWSAQVIKNRPPTLPRPNTVEKTIEMARNKGAKYFDVTSVNQFTKKILEKFSFKGS